MLRITIPAVELWDEVKEEFITAEKEQTLMLEHSLVSLSKWESKWCKPFLSKEAKTSEETIDYIKCMTITQNIDESIYDRLTSSNINAVMDYIEAPMTATTFSGQTKQGAKEIVTSEVIYCSMIALNIPMECQKWHLNRLLTLIRVCNIKNTPPKKMSRREVINKYAELNAARKKQFNSAG